jgi:hypothetical protein
VQKPVDILDAEEVEESMDEPKIIENVPIHEPIAQSGKMGRLRKDGTPVPPLRPRITAQDPALAVPNPHFTKYYSDDINAAKRTNKLWAWVKSLTPYEQGLIDVYVYRDWPPLLEASAEDDDFNNIDKFCGSELWSKDEEMNDKYGAGDFHCFVNVGLKPNRRTIATAWIKGNRSFRDLPPADKRITQMGEDGFPKYIDRHDPQCKTYVEFLRARGIIPEVHQAEKERLRMEAESAKADGMTTVERMATKMVDMAQAQVKSTPTPPNPLGGDSLKNVLDTALEGAKTSTEILKDTIRTLREGATAGNASRNDDTASVMETALKIATEISKANNPAEYLKIIGDQNSTIVKLQMDRLNDKIEQLSRQTTPAVTANPTPTSPIGGLKEMVKDFKELQELIGGAGEAAETVPGMWGVVERSMPHLATLGQSLLQMYLASQARGPMPTQPFPQGPPPNVIQMQPQGLPAPIPQAQPQQPQSQMQPPNGSAPAQPDAQALLLNVLNTIQVPLSNHLHDDAGGDDFANWFIGGFGEKVHQELLVYGEPALVMGMYGFPPIASRIEDVPRAQVETFVHEFCTFDWRAFDKKMQAGEKDPTPIA